MAFKPELIGARKMNKLTRKDISKIAEIIEKAIVSARVVRVAWLMHPKTMFSFHGMHTGRFNSF